MFFSEAVSYLKSLSTSRGNKDLNKTALWALLRLVLFNQAYLLRFFRFFRSSRFAGRPERGAWERRKQNRKQESTLVFLIKKSSVNLLFIKK
jgi:hypothetical protein